MGYQKELDDQMQLLQEEQAKIFDQFLKEKQMIDNIVAKIQQENEINTLRKIRAKEDNQKQIDVFLESQKSWHKLEATRQEKENEEIRQFLAEKATREAETEQRLAERR